MSLKVLNNLYASVQGLNGAGSISLVGTRVGDVVTVLTGTALQRGVYFEETISVDDQIQQTFTGDLSGSSPKDVFFFRQIASS